MNRLIVLWPPRRSEYNRSRVRGRLSTIASLANFEQLLRRVTQSALPETKLTRRKIEVSRQPTELVRGRGALLAGPAIGFGRVVGAKTS